MKITREIAEKVLATIDAGLVAGIGAPVPGKMCVEAAVCYAMGLPHGDEPACVNSVLRNLKITLNDQAWSSDKARASGMRRLGLAQLGSAGTLDARAFNVAVCRMTIGVIVPRALRNVAKVKSKHAVELERVAALCEKTPTRTSAACAASAATTAAYAADSAAKKKIWTLAVDMLIAMIEAK